VETELSSGKVFLKKKPPVISFFIEEKHFCGHRVTRKVKKKQRQASWKRLFNLN
jgi:hypothetical protein